MAVRTEAATRITARTGTRAVGVTVALGSVWGVVEATLGHHLHNAHVPLAGAVMIWAALACALPVRRLVRKPGAILAAGLMAASVKLLWPGSPFVLLPAMAILLEAAVMELALTAFGTGRVGFGLAGGITALYPLAHFTVKLILIGTALEAVYGRFLAQAGRALPLGGLAAPLQLAAYALVFALMGALVGILVTWLPSASRAPKA